MTTDIESSLSDSNFPPLSRYFLMDMEGNHTAAVINHGPLLQGLLVDNKRANLGILILGRHSAHARVSRPRPPALMFLLPPASGDA
jgi:hypothetical protein